MLILIIAVCNSLFAKELYLPNKNTDVKKETAFSLLELCSKHTKKLTADIYSDYGFKILTQKNYNRPQNQIDHTSAYTIGKGTVYIEEKVVSAYLITVRGTDGTEWSSNFDFSPAASSDTHFSMNFMASAEDIFLDFIKICKEENPVILVSGHSRGGAVSNLLGLLLNQVYDFSKIYVYTFATPATVRNLELTNDKNIFNFLNPCDVVPRVPPVQFGFFRAGTDIFLDDQSEVLSSKKITEVLDSLAQICPDMDSYYNKKLDLNLLIGDFGLSLPETNITFYELLMALSTELSKWTFTDEFDFSQDALTSTSNVGFILQEHLPETYEKKLKRYFIN